MKYVRGSFTVVPHLAQLDGINAGVFRLYVYLCSYANEQGECNPGIGTLSRRTGDTERTIRRQLKELEDLGLLVITPRYHHGRQTTNQYQLLIPLPADESVTLMSTRGDTDVTLEGDTDDSPGGDTDVTPCELNQYKLNQYELNRTLSTSDIWNNFLELADTQKNLLYERYQPQGFSPQLIDQELTAFVMYWTEPTLNGKKVRWQTHKTFDPFRRLDTWMRNKQTWGHVPQETAASGAKWSM